MTQTTTRSDLGATSRREPLRFATFDGLTLAYDDIGKQGAEPIVFLHGATDSRLTWDVLTPTLSETHRLLLLDARGQGDSDRDPSGYDLLDSYVGDVIALCEEVLDRPAVLVGASHGGVIAPTVAGRRPDLVRGLALLDPPMFGRVPAEVGELFATLEGLLATIASNDDRQAMLCSMLRAAPALSGGGTMVDLLGEDGVDRLAFAWSHVDPAFVAKMRAGAATDEPFGVDEPISCRVLVVRADPAAWACCFRVDHEERLRALAPQVEYVAASGLGHMLHHVQPAWVAEHLVRFLSSM